MFPITTRILIVDDTALMRRLMKDSLSSIGYKQITIADNGELAWREFESAAKNGAPYGLVVSDWNMPKVSGLDFLKMVRASDFGKKTPFVMLTAESEREKVMEAAQAGVSSYITKPFTTDTVKERLKAVYDKLHGVAPAPKKAG